MQDLIHHVRIRLSTTVAVDATCLASWLNNSIGDGRWSIRMDLEDDWLSWAFASQEDRMLFQLTWGYGLEP